MFPRRVSRAKLSRENTLEGVPPAMCVVTEKGTFFNKVAWLIRPGWELVGFTTPPFTRRESPDAIVFRKTSPAKDTPFSIEQKEPGLYWVHGNAASMKFVEIKC